jgi:hypothetical protein
VIWLLLTEIVLLVLSSADQVVGRLKSSLNNSGPIPVSSSGVRDGTCFDETAGVLVSVGGNQTTVGVGVSEGVGVPVGKGVSGVVGRQAVSIYANKQISKIVNLLIC